MIKRAVLLFVVILAVSSLIQFSMAAQESYEWVPCKIEITASEDWQPDSAFEVQVRIILASEISYKVRIHSVKVSVSSEGFSYSDAKLDGTELGTLGEYCENAFSFNFSTDKLSRGENFTVSIFAIINMYKLVGMWEHEQMWYNSDDPLTITFYMPLAPSPTPTAEPEPEPFPTTLVIATSAIIAVVCVASFVYFKKHNKLQNTANLQYATQTQPVNRLE